MPITKLRDASFYNFPLTRYARSVSVSATNGEAVETYTAAGSLWCNVTLTAGRRTTVAGGETTGCDSLIRVRGNPTLLATDRLEQSNGTIWLLDSIFYDHVLDEIVATAYKYDALVV